MPVIAESPPLVFGATPTPSPARTPVVPPRITPTPEPAKPVVTPSPVPVLTPLPETPDFVTRHEQFVNRVDSLRACFNRSELSDFSDKEFYDHSRVAMKDKYITREKDMYCSMQGINALTKTLKRLGED